MKVFLTQEVKGYNSDIQSLLEGDIRAYRWLEIPVHHVRSEFAFKAYDAAGATNDKLTVKGAHCRPGGITAPSGALGATVLVAVRAELDARRPANGAATPAAPTADRAHRATCGPHGACWWR